MDDLARIAWQTFLLIVKSYPMTLILSAASLAFALILGFLVALLKNSNHRPVKLLGTLYVNVFRNIPYIILIFTVFYGIPMLMEIHVSALAIAIVSLSLNQAAYFGEIIRGGLAKIDPGQIEAAEALGLGRWQRLRRIVVPQVAYMIGPAIMGQTTQLIKSTSVVSIIGLKELTGRGRNAVVSTHKPLLCFFWVALFYFITCFLLQLAARKVEKANLKIMRGSS